MIEEVEFMEDKTFLSTLPDTKIPEKSIEGWFYKHVPGSIQVKKYILLCIVIVLFAISAVFFLLSHRVSVDEVQSEKVYTFCPIKWA